eukprot:s24_g22.t1
MACSGHRIVIAFKLVRLRKAYPFAHYSTEQKGAECRLMCLQLIKSFALQRLWPVIKSTQRRTLHGRSQVAVETIQTEDLTDMIGASHGPDFDDGLISYPTLGRADQV